MNDIHGIIFAYSSHLRLKELTEHRTAASIPFGGRYRVIDFMLSSMLNAGISDVGVIMHESYQSLLDHLGSGKSWDLSRKRGGLKLLPPFGYAGSRSGAGFRGHMEALFGVTSYIDHIRQEYVLLADGDLVVNLPVEEIFEKHLESGADITCVVTKGRDDYTEHSAYMRTNGEGHVEEIIIGRPKEGFYQGLSVYIMSKKLLVNLMNHCSSHNLLSLRKDVLQGMLGKLNIRAHLFNEYCSRLYSITSYFSHSMELLDGKVRGELFNRVRPVRTKVRDEASTYYGPDSTAKNSLVADGCFIEGSVENCIIFRGVRVLKNASVKNSILMQDTVVNKGARLEYVITDKEVSINPERTLIGHASYPMAISKGITV